MQNLIGLLVTLIQQIAGVNGTVWLSSSLYSHLYRAFQCYKCTMAIEQIAEGMITGFSLIIGYEICDMAQVGKAPELGRQDNRKLETSWKGMDYRYRPAAPVRNH